MVGSVNVQGDLHLFSGPFRVLQDRKDYVLEYRACAPTWAHYDPEALFDQRAQNDEATTNWSAEEFKV